VPTYIRFSEDHSVVVLEDFAEITKRIRAAETEKLPLFEVTRADGPKLLVNASTIRTVSEGKKKDGGGKG
jgi:uncharacterized protein YlzI (FlbEa/FlbD family)